MFGIFVLFVFVNYKFIGILYSVVSIILGSVGFTLLVLFSLELLIVGSWVYLGDYFLYNSSIIVYGLIMIFGFIMLILLGGIVNYFLFVILLVSDMVFLSLNNMLSWLFVSGLLFLLFVLLIEEGIGSGWMLYFLLTCFEFYLSIGMDLVILLVYILGLLFIMNSINIMVMFIGLSVGCGYII